MDTGLLSGLAEGLKSGVSGYQEAKKSAQDQATKQRMMQMQMLSGGLTTDESGNLIKSPEQIEKESLDRQRLKYLYSDDNVDKAYKKAQIEFLKKRGEKIDNDPSDGLDRQLKEATLREKLNKENTATPDQSKVAIFADRLNQSEAVFNELSAKGYNRASPENSASSALSNIPLIGGMLGNLQGEDTRRQDQAERNFVNAVLRRESGSAISPSEFESAEKQYFARNGDTDKVLQQKADNRRSAIAGFQAEAGKALGLLKEQKIGLPKTTLPSGLIKASANVAPSEPKIGDVDDGLMYIGGDWTDPKTWIPVK